MKQSLKKLWFHIEYKRRLQCLFFIFLSLVCSIAEIMTLGAVIPFLGIVSNPETFINNKYVLLIAETFNINNSSDFLFAITVIFVLTAIVSGILRITLLFLQTSLSYGIGYDLSVKVFTTTICQPYTNYSQINSNQTISTISNKTNIVVGSVIMPILSIVSTLIMTFFIGLVLVIIDPLLVISIILVVTSIYAFLIYITNKKINFYSTVISKNLDKVVQIIQESLGNIRDVIINNSYNTYIKIYKNYDFPLRKAFGNSKIIAASPKFMIESIAIAVMAIAAYYLSKNSADIKNIIPVLGAIALGSQRVLPMLQSAYSSISSMKSGYIPLNDTLKLLDVVYNKKILETISKPMKFEKEILLENVSFQYSANASYILKNINIKIKKGDIVGIIGKTGAGKSTLLDLILGLIIPTSGSLKIDNSLIFSKNTNNWQANLAHVPQTIFLSDTTVAENIALGVPKENINLNQIKIASKKAELFETINGWDKKFETYIGERGVRLSGGQRQRIALARAFYKNAKVIVLDEGTSALDNDTENSIIKTIIKESPEVTIIMVSHRISNMKYCNLKLKVENNKVNLIE